jgi:hypothetical protein
VRLCGVMCRDVCFATPGGFRDPARVPWEDRTQPLVPALAGTGNPEGQPADIASEFGLNLQAAWGRDITNRGGHRYHAVNPHLSKVTLPHSGRR